MRTCVCLCVMKSDGVTTSAHWRTIRTQLIIQTHAVVDVGNSGQSSVIHSDCESM